ncbi:capsule assembly Wzi family protein [Runella slithyformis]|uniref:Capsule assembly Wzi family protein n=1 Tax=Runella slithyformis (strain ATCC 29530 / DSM 19594 / LMG 11500 / NCIMB 11436 / LSU 4) TaxID=761193 RepID=A0A7U3ZPJ1_RUNSL|nr:capsule assembly Wzi family protein [Runella slithyformis]AEI51001.1 hypothetical protein Runsl_4682 [Runella slithyformis DSM 19594]
MKKSLLFCALVLPLALNAQTDTTQHTTTYFAEAGGMAATNSRTPFWLRANQFGTVPLENPFAFVRLGGQTILGTDPRKPQLHLQGELVANAGKTSNVLLPAAAATLRFRKFEIYAGRRKEFFGLGDTLLTSGSYAWSGNALPLPKVQIGTRGFVPIGFTKGLFAVHAMMAHGWFINADSVRGSYLHQKAVFVRLGKPTWKVHFYAGVHHLAQWGGQWRNPVKGSRLTMENGKLPSDFATFLSIFTASEPSNTSSVSIQDALNRTGNHLGTIDFAMNYSTNRSEWLFYHQHPFDDKSGVFFVNFPDGLYGIRWKNKAYSQNSFQIKQVTVELLSTMSQSGFTLNINKRRFEGGDDYFVNYQYQEGWTYQKRVIGTSFITMREDAQTKWYNVKGGTLQKANISNNRVQVLHFGLMGQLHPSLQFRMLASQSWNHGRPILTDPAFPMSQFSGLLELSKTTTALGGVQLQAAVAVDQGPWLPATVGLRLGIRKTGFSF